MKWNLVNPSDPYTVESDNFKCAAVAACIVGEGHYPLEPIEDTNIDFEMPLFLFGGVDKWFNETFQEDFEKAFNDCLENKKASLVSALRSINISDTKRSSMNNIGGHAQKIADKFEANTKALDKESA